MAKFYQDFLELMEEIEIFLKIHPCPVVLHNAWLWKWPFAEALTMFLTQFNLKLKEKNLHGEETPDTDMLV